MREVDNIADDEIIFYDIETDHQYAPYATTRLIGIKYGFGADIAILQEDSPNHEVERFHNALQNPSILKVGFNNLNFDNIVLRREGFEICEEGLVDGYLMMKAIAPMVPSYGLKFLNWWFLGDPHFPEMELEAYAKKEGIDKWQAPNDLLVPYLKHDLQQHQNIFCLGWEIVQTKKHWEAYCLDMSQGEVVYEMAVKGGLFIDKQKTKNKVAILQNEIEQLKEDADYWSNGAVQNPNSSKQLGKYFDTEGFAQELSANGDFAVRKSDLLDLQTKNMVAAVALRTRQINGSLSFFKNYLRALDDTTYGRSNWIPTSFSISNARTRRYTSSSLYGLNFQNPDKEAKKVQIVPKGWLGFWIDATQIENVVHILLSEDNIRRQAYEADEEWSEYVWLCNLILGTNKTKDELDAVPSPVVPNWSVYKQFKTAKLALNFGMGVNKFCKTTGVSISEGKRTFDTIHAVCPAIHSLQEKTRKLLLKYGYVQDVFGHIYSGEIKKAYKVVCYWVQGLGTGSLPKAQMRACFDTLRKFDEKETKISGHLCTTTHDECGGLLSLNQSPETLSTILQKFMFNYTEKFSPKFDNIPLRAKLYISKTTNADRIEVKNLSPKFLKEFLAK